LDFGAVVGNRTDAGRDQFRRYFESAVDVPGVHVDRMAATSREHRIHLVVGVIERDGGTLYCTVLFFSPTAGYLGKHRKLMPTGGERLVWGMGDGSTLAVFDTPFGRLGGLTCWENYMPLARYAMYAQGVDVWCAPTWDNSDVWVSTLRHIAKEGRVFVIGVAPLLRGSDVPPDIPGRDELWGGEDDWMCRGYSAIVDPSGSVLAGPLVEEEGILYAEVDASVARAARQEFDPVGHYSRPDVFRLSIDTSARPPTA
ncbi:MAG TPA: nitrilase, partial [Actinobacteria bacterium]|nr:nitrilase [Actinomycetota bacterium]